MVLPTPVRVGSRQVLDAIMEVAVHLQATVIAPEAAQRKANIWLSMNAGHLLMAEEPELILSDPLQWRFRILRSVPRLDEPGHARRQEIGTLLMDAISGEVIEPKKILEELIANVDALVGRPA
jgi:hypothetical protein